ncbi:unnamed protein product [Cunninghamella blakesleeana]
MFTFFPQFIFSLLSFFSFLISKKNMVETSNLPPHPGLENVDIDDLKHKCPAFATGCPYAKIEEAESLAASFGELKKCPAFTTGCPFSNKSKEEIATLLSSIPKQHPTLNMNELPSCEEGILLVKTLNQFLTVSQLETLFDTKPKDELPILENPELASAMKEGTKKVHRAAESSVFTKRFLKGDISREEYGRYILSLYFVYQKMEALLNQYKDHQVVSIIHFPEELNREQALLEDLEYFYGKELVKQVIQPKNITPAVQQYLNAMDKACEKEPSLLIAHSYSRYLGDLSGGQILAKRLKKSILHLDEKDSSSWETKEGLKFYHFDQLGNQAEFKDFYRQRLNGAQVNAEQRDLIVKEAVHSFELNIALFDEIQLLSEKKLLPPMKLKKKRIIKQNTPPDSNISCWIMGTSLAVAAISIGFQVYKRYYVKND